MHNSIMPIDYDGKPIRTAEEADQIFFHANDICNALGYINPRKAISDFVEQEDVTKRNTLTSGGVQSTNFVNESGLYSLVFGSRLPKAKEFKRWVTSELLPTLRKNGTFTVTEPLSIKTDTKLYEELISTQRALIESQKEQLRLVDLVNKAVVTSKRTFWKENEDMILIDLRAEGMTFSAIGLQLNRSAGGCSRRYSRLGGK